MGEGLFLGVDSVFSFVGALWGFFFYGNRLCFIFTFYVFFRVYEIILNYDFKEKYFFFIFAF